MYRISAATQAWCWKCGERLSTANARSLEPPFTRTRLNYCSDCYNRQLRRHLMAMEQHLRWITMLEATGLDAPSFSARFGAYSSTSIAIRDLKASGEYNALLVCLSDKGAPVRLFREMQEALQEHHVDGYSNPMDVALLACRLALLELNCYHPKWDELASSYKEELNYENLSQLCKEAR